MEETTDDAAQRSRMARVLVLLALAALAAAFGRQMAIGSADKRFEEKLRALDANRE